MATAHIRPESVLALIVMLFQVVGVAALCLYRLLPATPWAYRGKVGFIVALVGLGVAGALCGRHDSEFGLFAGGTMTLLLIGMTSGDSKLAANPPAFGNARPEFALAA